MATRFKDKAYVFLDSNGHARAGGLVNFYITGTTTRKNTYTDDGLTTPNANPVVLDGSGRSATDIFLLGADYKTVITNSDATDAITDDPVHGAYSVPGTLVLPGAFDISAAAAGQIIFPATQVPSAGANTLDDYEEGTWTPAIGGSATYTLQIGTYTKIGRFVFIKCTLVINAIGTGSTTVISGLPFTATTGANFNLMCSYFVSIATAVTCLMPQVPANSSTINFNGTAAAVTSAGNTVAVFGNSARVEISGCYETT